MESKEKNKDTNNASINISTVISAFCIICTALIGYFVHSNDVKIDKIEDRINSIERDVYFIKSETSYLKGQDDKSRITSVEKDLSDTKRDIAFLQGHISYIEGRTERSK
jgi:hypothetical protein